MDRTGSELWVCTALTAERINPVPEATELLHSNLIEVFGERDAERRWPTIGRTYTEDVTFTDPDGVFVASQSLAGSISSRSVTAG